MGGFSFPVPPLLSRGIGSHTKKNPVSHQHTHQHTDSYGGGGSSINHSDLPEGRYRYGETFMKPLVRIQPDGEDLSPRLSNLSAYLRLSLCVSPLESLNFSSATTCEGPWLVYRGEGKVWIYGDGESVRPRYRDLKTKIGCHCCLCCERAGSFFLFLFALRAVSGRRRSLVVTRASS